uniref:Uncharacterized protein n=1 Tax=Lotharella globosa TaxID=91324 RepID=A0A7S3YCF8_9EUKA
MGCRCSKPELEASDREKRLLLEHAAQAEKVRLQIQTSILTICNKEEGRDEVEYKDHCTIGKDVVAALTSRWTQYLSRRTMEVIMNTAHRKGIWEIANESNLKEETTNLVQQHVDQLGSEEAMPELWRFIARDKKEETLTSVTVTCVFDTATLLHHIFRFRSSATVCCYPSK